MNWLLFYFFNFLVNSENHVLCYLKFSSSLESLIACSHLFSLRLSIKMLLSKSLTYLHAAFYHLVFHMLTFDYITGETKFTVTSFEYALYKTTQDNGISDYCYKKSSWLNMYQVTCPQAGHKGRVRLKSTLFLRIFVYLENANRKSMLLLAKTEIGHNLRRGTTNLMDDRKKM